MWLGRFYKSRVDDPYNIYAVKILYWVFLTILFLYIFLNLALQRLRGQV